MKPFFQFVVGEEDVACPEASDASGGGFEAHVLDGCADGLDVCQFHEVFVLGVVFSVVQAFGVHDEYDDRCLFQYPGGVDGGGDEFFTMAFRSAPRMTMNFQGWAFFSEGAHIPASRIWSRSSWGMGF